jgi:branched-chain amino acid transport system permease protein
MSYIFPGLVIGAVYAILGNSITLTYSATGVLNLATGSMAFVVADTFYYLIEVAGWSLWEAGILSIVIVGPFLGLLLWAAVFRRMEKSDFVVQVVATIGIAVALPALVQIALPTPQVGQAPGIVPHGLFLVHFWFISATRDQLAAVSGAILCVILLVLLVDRTRLGLQTRAVVDKPLLAQGRGINTNFVSAVSWVLAGLLIGIGAVLLSPLITLDSSQYTELVVTALSVALVGRFRGLIATAVSGLLLGVATSLLIGYAPQGNALIQGLGPSLPFFLLTILLVLGWSPVTTRRDTVQAQAGKRLARRVIPAIGGAHAAVAMPTAATGTPSTDLATAGSLAASNGQTGLSAPEPVAVRAGRTWSSHKRYRMPIPPFAFKAVLMAGLLLIGLFAFTDYWTGIIGVGLAFSVIFLSFTIATGEGAVLCLGEASFVAVGGFLAGRFFAASGLPFWAAAIVGVIASGLIGVVVGAIGARLDQIGFALVTLAFALFCEQFAFNIAVFVPSAGVPYPVFTWFGLTAAQTNVLMGFIAFVVIATIVGFAKRGRLGRAYAAMRGNPLSSESLGLDVRAMRTVVFAIAAAVAGLGGVLLGINEEQIGSVNVALFVGLVWVAVVVTFGVKGSQGAFLAGLVFSIVPAWFSILSSASWVGNLPTVLFGLGAVGLAKQPRGFLADIEDQLHRLAGRFFILGPPPPGATLAPGPALATASPVGAGSGAVHP